MNKQLNYLNEEFTEAVYTQIDYDEYVRPNSSSKRDLNEFFKHPENFESDFAPFAAASAKVHFVGLGRAEGLAVVRSLS